MLSDTDISLTPDIYTPSIDLNGNYIDSRPFIKNGIRCPCSSRHNKVYDTIAKFTSHTKSKCHKKWIEQLNKDKMNHYMESIKSHEIIETQKIIIAKLEKELSNKSLTIDYLTKELINKNTNLNSSCDLLDIDT